MNKYRLRNDSITNPAVKAGSIVYDLTRWDYGCSSDDTRAFKEKWNAVTLKEDGDYPFFTVPGRDLELIE